MPAPLPHPARLLLEAADPLASLPREMLADQDRFDRVAAEAARHGVLPILRRKMREQRRDATVALPPEWTEGSTIEAGQAMLLRHHGRRLARAFEEAGIQARIVKGPVFADTLYRNAADRPFTDIDFLVRKTQIDEASRVMSGAGFFLPAGEPASRRLQEYKWFLADNPTILVEIHGDLVHLPGLRQRFSLDLDRLAAIDAGGSETPAALLLIAVVHATGGHKFHRLQLIVDALQAVRALRSANDEAHALRAARACGAALEFATVLDVTHRLFGEERAGDLARRASSSMPDRIARRLITPQAVLDAGAALGWRSRLRRDAFRWTQRLAKRA